MAKVRMMLFVACLVLVSFSVSSEAITSEDVVRYFQIGGKGQPIIEFKYFKDDCTFWEYSGAVANEGSWKDDPGKYQLNTIGFKFEYPKPFDSTSSWEYQGVDVRYAGKKTIKIGRSSFSASRFFVTDGERKYTIYFGDNYKLPMGYDVGRRKVRMSEDSLATARSIECKAD